VGEVYHKDCIIPTVKFGIDSIMVWGCMSSMRVGKLYVCENRMNSTTYTSMLKQVLKLSVAVIYKNNPPNDVILQ
jgi:hypothetical protein